MKNIIPFIYLFTIITFAQKEKGAVTLINGDIKNGLVKVTANKIIYKSSKDAKAEKYDFSQAKSATIKDKKGVESIFEFVTIKEGKDPELLEVLVNGYLKLYGEGTSVYMVSAPAAGGGFGHVGGVSSTSTFYLKKENENTAQFYTCKGYVPKISFTKLIDQYFNDCPEIQQKVENKEFKKKHYKEIVEFYNQNCASKE